MEDKIMKNIEYEKEILKRQLQITIDKIKNIRIDIARMAWEYSIEHLEAEVKLLKETSCEYRDISKRISLLNNLLEEDNIEDII